MASENDREEIARQMFETMEKPELIDILISLGVRPDNSVPITPRDEAILQRQREAGPLETEAREALRTYHNPIETLAQAVLDGKVLVERTTTDGVALDAMRIVILP